MQRISVACLTRNLESAAHSFVTNSPRNFQPGFYYLYPKCCESAEWLIEAANTGMNAAGARIHLMLRDMQQDLEGRLGLPQLASELKGACL